jgi:tRNA1Val (adenine37-N6)-methyltransferase
MNAQRNRDRLRGSARFVRADIREPELLREYKGRFDCVVANPPFWRAGQGRLAPDPSRAASRHELAATLGDFLAVAALLLVEQGQSIFILRPERLSEAFREAERAGCPIEALRPIYTRPESEACWIIVAGTKDGRAGVRVLPPRELWREEADL